MDGLNDMDQFEQSTLTLRLGELQPAVDEGLRMLCENKVIGRIWQHDHTVWQPEPTEITNRLGWLHIMDRMGGEIGRLNEFAEQIAGEGSAPVLHARAE